MEKIIKRLLISSLLLLAISGCDEQKSSYRYKVVDKSRDIDSHYNFFTEKQVVETAYFVILQADDGTVVSHKCSSPAEFYGYQIGKTYIFNRQISY